MKFYWDAFIDEMIAGKIEDYRDVEGKEEKEPVVVRLEDTTPRELCRLFYEWVAEKHDTGNA